MQKRRSVPKKNYLPSLVVGVTVMIAVFVITSVIGLTVLVIKRDSTSSPTLQLANPAAKNCLERHGGTVIEKIDAEKNVWSYCSLSNGKQCEVWELFRTQSCHEPPLSQQAQ